MTNDILNAMAQSVTEGNVEIAANLVREAIDQGIDPLDAINNGFVVGLNQVGEDFSSGIAYLPDLILAGEVMKIAMAVLEPELARRGTQRESSGAVVLATVEGDIHDIGKNIVGSLLSASGFMVHDLGVDVSTSQIVEKVREADADIVALSALLTTTMMKQEDVIKALEDAGLRDNVKIIVGGAPVTQDWAETIGADGFGEDAMVAVRLAQELTGES